MKDELTKLLNAVCICQEINKRANDYLVRNSYSDFTRVQLRTIAELSATRSIEANREARKKLAEWETELLECKQMFDNRTQPLYHNDTEKADNSVEDGRYAD